ncbi:MAG TPA: hypothetical protein VE871_20860 [Longimicrobium sp.]|nr:hypothetical protein [Longimicrobium sp.]
MKKLNLDVLQIETFVASPAFAGAPGTVRGHEKPTDTCESVIRCSGACPSAACSEPYC